MSRINTLQSRLQLLLAGDVSHKYDRLQQTFATLQATGCQIVFCPGNHEAWLWEDETTSYEKLQRVEQLCRDQGVLARSNTYNELPSITCGLCPSIMVRWFSLDSRMMMTCALILQDGAGPTSAVATGIITLRMVRKGGFLQDLPGTFTNKTKKP
jgi:hypothetical protein